MLSLETMMREGAERDSMDRVDQVEAEVHDALLRANLSPAQQLDAVERVVCCLLETLPIDLREGMAARVLRRHSDAPLAPPDDCGGGTAGLGAGRDPGAAQKARANRVFIESEARIADLQADLEARGRELTQVQKDLSERMQAYRKLQRRADEDRTELTQQMGEVSRLSAALRDVQSKLAETEEAKSKASVRLIRAESELEKLRAMARDEGDGGQAPRLECATTADSAGGSSAAPSAFAAFCDTLCEHNRVQRAEVPRAAMDSERKLGMTAAALVVFEETIERGVFAMLEELGQREDVVGEHLGVLQYLRGGDRPWWRHLTESGGRQRSHDRRFGMYLAQLAKIDCALLTAFYRIVCETVAQKARELLNPVELRKRCGRSQPDELWKYYEETASTEIAHLLGDRCRQELVKTIDQLYRSAGDAR